MIYTHTAVAIVAMALGMASGWNVQKWRYQSKETMRLEAQVQAEKRRDKASYDASVNYEKERQNVQTRFRTITVEVEKIVDRPIYGQQCLDNDGLRIINDAIKATASKPSATVPASQ